MTSAQNDADRKFPAAVQARLDRLGVLGQAFLSSPLKLLDVGARGGALSWMPFLAPFSHYYACEPDPAAAIGLQLLLEKEHPWRSVTLMGEGLGSRPGEATLKLTRQPGLSSVFTPNAEVAAAFGLASEFTVEDTFTIPIVTLTDAASRYGFQDLSVIKLDTQGSELDILRSGQALIESSVQAVFIEVEFRPFYQGQPLFADIDIFLRGAGFDIVHLQPVSRRRKPVGSPPLGYSQHELIWGHTFYVKGRPDPEALGAEKALRYGLAQIMCAMATEHFDLAADRLCDPAFAELLKGAGLAASYADLEAYVRMSVPETLYKEFVKEWPDIARAKTRHLAP